MRIIGGSLGGRLINPPLKKWPTRPTTDMAREALYNILSNSVNFSETSMLDLFGGSGAHALEFISRGSQDVTYVESFMKCIIWFKSEVKRLGLEDHIQIMRSDVFKYLKRCKRKFDVVFADPPYAHPSLSILPTVIFENDILEKNGLLIIEHGDNSSFEDHPMYKSHRNYGQSRFTFFQAP